MTQFRNPYNFVPLGETVERTPYTQLRHHHRFYTGNYSGQLVCCLKTLTRLFIPSRCEDDIDSEMVVVVQGNKRGKELHWIFKKFLRNAQGEPMIPGTSIRGMVRAVAETISNSCLTLYKSHYDLGEFKHQNCKIADDKGKPVMEAGQGVCVCCQIFGFVNEQSGAKDDEEGQILRNVLATKVVFGDAALKCEDKDKIDRQVITLKELSQPKPHHDAFYVENDQIKGRKFYYHQHDALSNYKVPVDEKNPKTKRNQTIHESITVDAGFTFDVRFTNLTDKELGLLLWALELDNGLAHKIGMGKPIGLGSVNVRVTSMELMDPKERYQSLGSGKETIEGSTLTQLRDVLGTGQNPFEAMWELRNILTFDLTVGEFVHYPKFNWFHPDPSNRSISNPTLLPSDAILNELSGRSATSTRTPERQNETPRPMPVTHETQRLDLSALTDDTTTSRKQAFGKIQVEISKIDRANKPVVKINGELYQVAHRYLDAKGKKITVSVKQDEDGKIINVERN